MANFFSQKCQNQSNLKRRQNNQNLQAFVPQDTLPGGEFRSLARTTPQRLRELEKLMAPFADKIIIRGA